MPASPSGLPAENYKYMASVWDESGRPILTLTSSGECMIHESNGDVSVIHSNNSIVLMCGTVWHPNFWKTIPIAVCELCRHPPYRFPLREKPKSGLVSLKKAEQCASSHCHRLLCPRHAVKCSDGKVRCPWHAFIFKVQRLGHNILYTYEEA